MDPWVPLRFTTDPDDPTIQPPWIDVVDLPQDEGPEGVNLQLVVEVTNGMYAPGVFTIALQRVKYIAGKPDPKSLATPDLTAIHDYAWPVGRNKQPRRVFHINYSTAEYGNESKRLRVLVSHDADVGADLQITVRVVKNDNPMQYLSGRAAPKDT
jgi:hypothetical protein